MTNRLDRIVTRSGDSGMTGLADGTRLSKHDARIGALGAIDETGAAIGWLVVAIDDQAARHRATDIGAAALDTWVRWLLQVQHDLFDIGAELALPGHGAIDDRAVVRVEEWTQRLNADLAPLREFILAGGTEAAARAHLARTICRRAERTLVAVQGGGSDQVDRSARGDVDARSRPMPAGHVRPEALRFVNRLSDLLFVLARALNAAGGRADVLWERDQASRDASR